eukprot:5319362-Pyramimonas_sp.AAC.1
MSQRNQYWMAPPYGDGLVLLARASGHLRWASPSTLIHGRRFSPEINLRSGFFNSLEHLRRVPLRLGLGRFGDAVLDDCLGVGLLRVKPEANLRFNRIRASKACVARC